jgi:hypothetical protein
MSSLSKKHLLIAFAQLGKYLRDGSPALEQAKQQAAAANAWFTKQEIERAITALAMMLEEEALTKWFETITPAENAKKVGLILAGNIPMVGFHDVICVLASGHQALIKLSSSDQKLIPAVLAQLISYQPELALQISFVQQLKDFDAVIATGSNNSSRYFDYYFGKFPHIIRRNRNSVAVLSGAESAEEIAQLGHDIFDYFGLGCRNVSKLYVPKNYDFKLFFEPLESFKDIIHHHKYNNNYDYNKSIFLVNQVAHLDNGFLLLKADEQLASPLAVVHFEYYENTTDLAAKLMAQSDEIQCVLSGTALPGIQTLAFGQGQCPQLWDYADKVDTVDFLTKL